MINTTARLVPPAGSGKFSQVEVGQYFLAALPEWKAHPDQVLGARGFSTTAHRNIFQQVNGGVCSHIFTTLKSSKTCPFAHLFLDLWNHGPLGVYVAHLAKKPVLRAPRLLLPPALCLLRPSTSMRSRLPEMIRETHWVHFGARALR